MSKDEGERIEVEGHVTFGPPTMSAQVKVYNVDDIRLEKSPTVRYVWSPSGAFLSNHRIEVLVDGKWHDLTRERDMPTNTEQMAQTVEGLRTELKDAEGRLMEKIDDLGQLTYDVHQRLGPRPGELIPFRFEYAVNCQTVAAGFKPACPLVAEREPQYAYMAA